MIIVYTLVRVIHTKDKEHACTYISSLAVCNQWTGPLDWTTGLKYFLLLNFLDMLFEFLSIAYALATNAHR